MNPARPNIPVLPGELVDTILDHLHDDKSTLSSCALVSRQFLCTSRYHIFRTLKIKGSPESDSYPPYLELLLSNAAICSNIRDLHITGSISPWGESTTTSLPLLHSILVAATSLRSLELRGLSIPYDCSLKTSQTMSLEKLVLCTVVVDPRTVLLFLSLFSMLGTLQIQDLSKLGDYTSGTESSTHLRAKSISLQGSSSWKMNELFKWITPTNTDFESLDVNFGFRDILSTCMPDLDIYLRTHGRTITNLRIDFAHIDIDHSEYENGWPQINLASCPSLRSLHLRVFVANDTLDCVDAASQWEFAAFLISAASSNIQDVTLGVWISETDPEYGYDGVGNLDALEQALLECSGLKRVTLEDEDPTKCAYSSLQFARPLSHYWRLWFTKRLSQLDTQGILKFL